MAAKGWDPAEYLSLQDICLWEATLKRGVDEYQPAIHDGKMRIQRMRGLTADELEVVDGEGEGGRIIRVLVHLGARSLFAKDQGDAGDSNEHEMLYEVVASFAVSYAVIKDPPEELMEDFYRFNCVHNVWPFWRQHVYDTLKRASLPLIEVPFFSGKPTSKRQSKKD